MSSSLAIAFCLVVLVDIFSVSQSFIVLFIAAVPRRPLASPAGSFDRQSVCVLVPCFNEREVVRRTLESILGSAGVDIARVICVDDGSTDGTAEVATEVKQRRGDRVIVLRQANAGKAAALNHALTVVNTAAFVSVDADTQVTPDAIANLLGHLQDEDVAAVSGQMLVGNRNPLSRAVYAAQAREYEFANNIDRRAFSRLDRITVVPGAIGAFRTAAVSEVGGYPTETLAEDAHLTFNLLMSGYKVVHEPSAVVLTEAPDSISGLFKQRVRWATGKTQVVIRTGAQALGQRGAVSLLWAYTALNQAILPLFKLLTPLGTVGIPVYFFVAHSTGARPPLPDYLPAMTIGAVVLTLLQLAQSCLAARFARGSDVGIRTAAGLDRTRLGLLSLAIMPITAFMVSWVAWYAIITGRRNTWNKLERTGDVALPPPGGSMTER